jgi:spore maturation protein CgeB
MAKYGFSPATRIFEAAGAGACMISDVWDGIDQFFDPGREILLASSGRDVAQLVSEMTPERAHALGQAAKTRALAEHTYARRVDTLEAALAALQA